MERLYSVVMKDELGVGDGRQQVGCAGAGCYKNRANFTRAAGIAFSRVGGGLFMPHQNVTDALLLEDRIINGKHSAARIAENNLNTEIA